MKDQIIACEPTGNDFWCRSNRATATGENYSPRSHNTDMKQIFRGLSNPELLKRYLHGRTQNSNESVNNLIWTRVPKNIFVSKNTLEFSVFEAIATFNNGNIIKCNYFVLL